MPGQLSLEHTIVPRKQLFMGILLISHIGLLMNHNSSLVNSSPTQVTTKGVGSNSDDQVQHQPAKEHYGTLSQGVTTLASAHTDGETLYDKDGHTLITHEVPSNEHKCFIELRTTERMQGKCAKLGLSGMPFCLAQGYLSMDMDSCS